MTLEPDEYLEYVGTHLQLLFYVGKKMRILPAVTKIKEFLTCDNDIKFECDLALYENENLIASFLKENKTKLRTSQVEIINAFKYQIRGEFIIAKSSKNYAIFKRTDTQKFYTVHALRDSFEYFFDSFPVMVNTALVRYKDIIIYNGFMKLSEKTLDQGITPVLKAEYQEAKRRNEVIRTL